MEPTYEYEYEVEYPLQPDVLEVPRRHIPILEVLGAAMIFAAVALLAVNFLRFNAQADRLPAGLTLGGVPVGGMLPEQASSAAAGAYLGPITVTYGETSWTLDPAEVGFTPQTEQMLAEANTQIGTRSRWAAFLDYLWVKRHAPVNIPLSATYDENALRAWISNTSAQIDRLPEADQPGITLDQAAAFNAIDRALRSIDQRSALLNTSTVEATPTSAASSIDALGAQILGWLVDQQYRGVLSLHVIDQRNGDELILEEDFRNGTPQPTGCAVAYAGLSTMKIPLLVEYYRYLAFEPFPYEQDVIDKTMIESSNAMANAMMFQIGGENSQRGSRIVTDSMRYLGMENSFLAAPYDEEDPPEYYSTPAREAARAGTCVDTKPDEYMQTTASDMAILLDAIYQCAEMQGGDLLAAYHDTITPQECQAMLNVMKQNAEGKLLRSGLPEETDLAHKHGYTFDTISDAGVVFSPGGDYVIVAFMFDDQHGWLATYAFPLMQGISSITFNYFNPDMVDVPRQGYGDLLEVAP